MDALKTPALPVVSTTMDLAPLKALKGAAQKDPTKALKGAAQQFESLFIQEMLKSMREANEVMKSDLMSNSATDTFESMFDREVALKIAERGAFGVGRMLERSLSPTAAPAAGSTQDALRVRQAPAGLPLQPPAQAGELHTPTASWPVPRAIDSYGLPRKGIPGLKETGHE